MIFTQDYFIIIADCLPAYYGMTHPAQKYYLLKDRRPAQYRELIAPAVNFLNIGATDLNLKTDFLKGGYTYPRVELNHLEK